MLFLRPYSIRFGYSLYTTVIGILHYKIIDRLFLLLIERPYDVLNYYGRVKSKKH